MPGDEHKFSEQGSEYHHFEDSPVSKQAVKEFAQETIVVIENILVLCRNFDCVLSSVIYLLPVVATRAAPRSAIESVDKLFWGPVCGWDWQVKNSCK